MSKEIETTNNNDNDTDTLKRDFTKLVKKVDNKIKILEEREKHWAALETRMEEYLAQVSDQITLNIGGKKFATSKSTLLSQRGSFFDAMLSSGRWKPDAKGRYFIDRDPTLFPVILNYLRNGKLNLKQFTYDVSEDLKVELDFYLIDIPEITKPISKLLNAIQQGKIREWTNKLNFTLLYAASIEGFTPTVFHSKCDNKGPTLILARSTTGYLFGAYATTSWDSSSTYRTAPGSFLFTLTNPYNIPPTKYVINTGKEGNAMYCQANYGPTFGSGHDLYFSSQNISFNFPHGYIDATGKGSVTFAGATSFTVNELEVYLVS